MVFACQLGDRLQDQCNVERLTIPISRGCNISYRTRSPGSLWYKVDVVTIIDCSDAMQWIFVRMKWHYFAVETM